jgi:hypothetical protein
MAHQRKATGRTQTKQVAGKYEEDDRILHLWFPQPVQLRDPASLSEFFDEVIRDWIDPTPGKFYLLVNYTNLHIGAHVADAYANAIGRFQHRLLGTFRYNLDKDFTGVAVGLGNLQLKMSANVFPDEASARAAIHQAKQK